MDLIIFLLESAAIDFFLLIYIFFTTPLRILTHILFSPPSTLFSQRPEIRKMANLLKPSLKINVSWSIQNNRPWNAHTCYYMDGPKKHYAKKVSSHNRTYTV